MHLIKCPSLFIIFFNLLPWHLQLELNIIDDIFLNIFFGTPGVKLKLLIDPFAEVSFIFKKYQSNTLIVSDLFESDNHNLYKSGNYPYANDLIFFVDNSNILYSLNMTFMYVENESDFTHFGFDGVLALGKKWAIDPQNRNFYEGLELQEWIKNSYFSYNKHTKLATIGSLPSIVWNSTLSKYKYHFLPFSTTGGVKHCDISKMIINNNDVQIKETEAEFGFYPRIIVPEVDSDFYRIFKEDKGDEGEYQITFKNDLSWRFNHRNVVEDENDFLNWYLGISELDMSVFEYDYYDNMAYFALSQENFTINKSGFAGWDTLVIVLIVILVLLGLVFYLLLLRQRRKQKNMEHFIIPDTINNDTNESLLK